MAVTARVLGGGGLVAVGIVAALAVGTLPAIGSPPAVRTAAPSSAAQSLACPGPALAVGAQGTDADEFSATGKPVRVTGTTGGARVRTATLGRGDVQGGTAARIVTAPPADSKAGPIAGAQLESVSGGDAVGLAATACTTPAGEAWFAAGSTTTGRSTVLILTNPSKVDAQVAVRLWTEDGPVDIAGTGEVTVPRHGRRAVSLAGLAPTAGGTVVQLVSTGGRIGAALEQRTVRGLESGGVDLVGGTAAPARRQVIPGLRVSGAATVASTQREDDFADLQPVVRVLLPGRRAAEVRIRVTPDGGGQSVVVGRRVEPGVVTDFPVPGLGDGTYTATVAAAERLVAGARVSVVGDPSASTTPTDEVPAPSGDGPDAAPGSDAGLVGGDGPVDTGSRAAPAATSGSTSTARGIDLAWFAAARRIGEVAAVAVVDGPAPVLTIANPGPARTVRLTGAVDQEVPLPARGSASVAVAKGVVVLRGAAGTTAAVSYAGTGALAGYPVGPADQRARAVPLSR